MPTASLITTIVLVVVGVVLCVFVSCQSHRGRLMRKRQRRSGWHLRYPALPPAIPAAATPCQLEEGLRDVPRHVRAPDHFHQQDTVIHDHAHHAGEATPGSPSALVARQLSFEAELRAKFQDDFSRIPTESELGKVLKKGQGRSKVGLPTEELKMAWLRQKILE
uniref:Uncharacterized protein n=1 Tax=Mycena chlorophos TaxID=658473 RepID=A0ABQ0M1P8_MYCCL|nr:predicted protein [Mycena chlorophos]